MLCTAGYRVNLERPKFIEHAAWEFQGLGWPATTEVELNAALDRLVSAHLMAVLTDEDLRAEADRRAASALPELDDTINYRPGHVDFTQDGYRLYRALVREICGDGHLDDAGFNLDSSRAHLDVYAVTSEGCAQMMDAIQQDGDSYAGVEGTTFTTREGPTQMGAWRPNRFSSHASGYHGVLRYVIGAAHKPLQRT